MLAFSEQNKRINNYIKDVLLEVRISENWRESKARVTQKKEGTPLNRNL